VVAPGGTVDPTLVFDTGPTITITGVGSQDLTASGTTTITYDVTLQPGLGNVQATWTDTCGGSFVPPSETHDGSGPFSSSTTYQAPAVAPGSPECDLTVTVVDGAGATTWSQVVVWVAGPAPLATKVVFVTSTKVDGMTFNGDPANADAFCQARADAGVGPNKAPAGTYKAFLSFSGAGNSAGERIADGRYVLADGTPVAASKADLFDGSILNPIELDENGSLNFNYPWTGTSQAGALSSNCNSWTTNNNGVFGTAGAAFAADSWWIEENDNAWCSDTNPIYCFQQ